MSEALKEGWFRSKGSTGKYHYYVKGRSLCIPPPGMMRPSIYGRVEVEANINPNDPNNCEECRKILEKRER